MFKKHRLFFILIIVILFGVSWEIYKETSRVCPDGSYPLNTVVVKFKNDISINQMEAILVTNGPPLSYKDFYQPHIIYKKLPNQLDEALLEKNLTNEKGVDKCGLFVEYSSYDTSCSFSYDVNRSDIQKIINKYPQINLIDPISKTDELQLEAPNLKTAQNWMSAIKKLPDVEQVSMECIGTP